MTSAPLFNARLAVPPLGLELRSYQADAVAAIYTWFETQTGNPLVVVPTGGGKSIILAAFAHSVLAQWPTERILVLTHVRELISQNHATMLRCWPGAPAGIYSAGLGRRDTDEPILFAGIQSVYTRAAELGWIDLCIVDEAHLIPKDGFGMYRRLLGDLSTANPKLKVIGLTATPFRTDSGSLEQGKDRLFHGIAYDCDLVQLIKDGWLSPVTCRGTKAPIDTAGVKKQAGDFVANQLESAAMTGDLVSRAVEEIVARGHDRKGWLIFCCGLWHASDVAGALRSRGIEAATVFGEDDKERRDKVVSDFRSGTLRAAVNVNVLTTGFDVPHVDLIALLRPTCSPGLYVQMVGRGLRRAPGKTDCLVLDFGGNVLRHGPIDQVKIKQPGESTGIVPARECPKCALLVSAAMKACPECGYEWPQPIRMVQHDAEPDEAGTLVRGMLPNGGIERWNVEQVTYREHHKAGKPTSLCVEYRCGWRRHVSEWVCFAHDGYAKQKAVAWWRQRGGQEPAPATAAEAIQRIQCAEVRSAASVTVDVRGDWPELRNVRLHDGMTEEELERQAIVGEGDGVIDSVSGQVPF